MLRDVCAIDFGTSNSAVARPAGSGVELAELEAGFTGMPTAVFYNADDNSRSFGRAAVAAYVDGYDGRLMRSIKSILGSDLMQETTEVGGLQLRYIDVVVAYLRHLKTTSEKQYGAALERTVIGRPVFFVDDDPRRDAQAQETLHGAARAVGFRDVEFEYEPIAAALDYETRIDRERIVLVADIGGGTSDFSIVRVGPKLRLRSDRRSDILANHGVHIAGTDFDRAVNLAAIMPTLGLGTMGPENRPVPSRIYFDLATWHLINGANQPGRLAELRAMRGMYLDAVAHRRLLHVLDRKLGHELAALAERAKIETAIEGHSVIDLTRVEAGLQVAWNEARQVDALDSAVSRIVAAAHEALTMADLTAAGVDALYFTGGSTGLNMLAASIESLFPEAESVRGDRYTSVVSGLAQAAKNRYGASAEPQP